MSKKTKVISVDLIVAIACFVYSLETSDPLGLVMALVITFLIFVIEPLSRAGTKGSRK